MRGEVRRTVIFHQRVYAMVRAIPEGKVTTYGDIALSLGAPRHARQVGYALATLHEGNDVPAHRVVNRSGVLTGAWAFGPPDMMRGLLEAEGVTFLPDGRVNLRAHLHIPPEEPLGPVDYGMGGADADEQ